MKIRSDFHLLIVCSDQCRKADGLNENAILSGPFPSKITDHWQA